MAVDKLVDSSALDTKLTQVANAIRGKTGDSASLAFPGEFVDAISELTNVEDTTAAAGDVLDTKYFYTAAGIKTQGNIASKSSSDLSASGATVTVPAGYYSAQVSKSVSFGSATTPATTVTVAPSISVSSSGLITATNSKTQDVIPTVSAGYVLSGTAGTITVNGSNTSQLSTQAAQTITPGTSNITIASGKYLTGTQTINGDANLVSGNIKKGTSIFGVSGSSTVVNVSDTTATQYDVLEGTYFYLSDGTRVEGWKEASETFYIYELSLPLQNSVTIAAYSGKEVTFSKTDIDMPKDFIFLKNPYDNTVAVLKFILSGLYDYNLIVGTVKALNYKPDALEVAIRLDNSTSRAITLGTTIKIRVRCICVPTSFAIRWYEF